MIGVKGWYSANWRMPWPILAAGTIALEKNGSMTSGTVAMAADCGVLAASPIATVSQLVAKQAAMTMPATASQSPALADGRKPSPNATAMIAVIEIRLRSMVTMTWPVMTAPRETSITRSRLMIPVVMSALTSVAVAPRP